MGNLKPLTIHYATAADGKRPYPIQVDAEMIARSGLGADDGAQLLGFAVKGEQMVSKYPEDVIADPSIAVGMIATFGFGGIFAWDVPIESVTVAPDSRIGEPAEVTEGGE